MTPANDPDLGELVRVILLIILISGTFFLKTA